MGDYTLADWVGLLGNNHVVELMEGEMGQSGVQNCRRQGYFK